MTNNMNVQYYVEGEDERKLVNTLKTELRLIIPGKVDVFNVTSKSITNARLITLKPKTVVVLIFDTDVGNDDILKKNISVLMKCKNVVDIITIPQSKNLEDELVRCCKIKSVTDLLNSQSVKNFKSDFIKTTNLQAKLTEKEFDISKLWILDGKDGFDGIANQSQRIKIIE